MKIVICETADCLGDSFYCMRCLSVLSHDRPGYTIDRGWLPGHKLWGQEQRCYRCGDVGVIQEDER